MLILGSDDVNYLGTLLVLLGLGAGLYAAGVALELLSERPKPITDDDLVSEFADLVVTFNSKEKPDAAD
jgi:hypothetical protein